MWKWILLKKSDDNANRTSPCMQLAVQLTCNVCHFCPLVMPLVSREEGNLRNSSLWNCTRVCKLCRLVDCRARVEKEKQTNFNVARTSPYRASPFFFVYYDFASSWALKIIGWPLWVEKCCQKLWCSKNTPTRANWMCHVLIDKLYKFKATLLRPLVRIPTFLATVYRLQF